LFHVLSIIFKDWIKDALSELSFQKRETIRSSSNSLSTIPDLPAQDRLVVDFPPLHPEINRQDENIEVTDFLAGPPITFAVFSLVSTNVCKN
jgi:hypothetical protein